MTNVSATQNDELIRKSDALAIIATAARFGYDMADVSDSISALPAVTVEVKPLVWEGNSDTKRCGDYRVGPSYGQGPAAYMVSRGSTLIWWTQTEAEGMEVAEKDNRVRVLAALEPVAAPDLTDPVTVHANMLRGTIAKPTLEQIIHLYGVDALVKALAPVIVQEADNEPS